MGLSLISFILLYLQRPMYDAMSLQQGSDFKLFFHHDVTFDYFFGAHIESPWDASVLFLIRQQSTIIFVVIFGHDYILLFLVTIHKILELLSFYHKGFSSFGRLQACIQI
jgi:hypothetical protein